MTDYMMQSDSSEHFECVKEVTRFDNKQAFIFLFALSFGPAFIVVDLTTEGCGTRAFYIANCILVIFIVLTFCSNTVSVWMLTRIQSQTKLGSYQEVAYWISKGNRGYIFLISLMKVVYLVTTCAYCLQFIANYLTVFTQICLGQWVDFKLMNAWAIWGIYVLYLVLLSCVTFYFYSIQKCHNRMINQSKVLFYTWSASVGLLVLFLLLSVFDSYKNWVYKEVCYNSPFITDIGNSAYSWAEYCCVGGSIVPADGVCKQPVSVNQTGAEIFAKSVSFVPTIAYCNMFSIFYLEIISTTKLVSGKTKSDSMLGWQVNAVISVFYFTLFATLLIMQALANEGEIAIQIYFIKNWYMMQLPYNPQIRHSFTIFDLSMILLCVILWIHCLMNLYVAKESALIYTDEAYTKSLSQLLDLKRQGVDGTYLKTDQKETPDEDLSRQTQVFRMTYMKLDKKMARPVIVVVFTAVVTLALINTPHYLILVGLWGVVSSIVCPIIVTVLPGSFFYYVLKEQEVDSKLMKAIGITFCVFGLGTLPLFLTLSTKNLFSTTQPVV